MKPYLCLVCGGSGKYPRLVDESPFFIPKQEPKITKEDQTTCHGCNGKGWITVSEERPYFPSRNYKDKLRHQENDKKYTRLTISEAGSS